jgi:hypothetical protein
MGLREEQAGAAKHGGAVGTSSSAVTRDEVFVPMASDGVAWLRICEPQQDAATAWMRVAEYIRLLEPGREADELEAAARSAAKKLESGAASATVVDELHRVERFALEPQS